MKELAGLARVSCFSDASSCPSSAAASSRLLVGKKEEEEQELLRGPFALRSQAADACTAAPARWSPSALSFEAPTLSQHPP